MRATDNDRAKLLPTQPCHGGVPVEGSGENGGYSDDHRVATSVAKAIIDGLEPVHVEDHEASISINLLQCLSKGTPVEKPRQHVRAAQLLELRSRDAELMHRVTCHQRQHARHSTADEPRQQDAIDNAMSEWDGQHSHP